MMAVAIVAGTIAPLIARRPLKEAAPAGATPNL